MAIMSFEGGKVQILDTSGNVLDGGKLTFNEVGTSTKKDTFTTSALSVANANPFILDSSGRGTIWMSGNYDVVITDKNDVSVYTFDDTNFTSASTTSSFNLIENGSFEVNDDGDTHPDSWVTTTYSGGTVSLDTSDQQHAGQSAKFNSTGSGGGYVTSTNFIEVSDLVELVMHFELKSSVVDLRNLVQILWFDSAKASISTTILYDESAANPTSWTAKTFLATPPSTSRFAKVELYGAHSSDATSGNTWYDNVTLRPYDQNVNLGADIASASTVTIPDGVQYADVTGTTTITLLSSDENYVKLHFDGILTLTHHATNLILPGAANITTAAGDEAEFVQYASDDFRCVNYTRASGIPLFSGQMGGEYIKLSDVKSAGTSAGTFTLGAWRTRTLNTEDSDTGGNCSLSSNQFTLDAGTYIVSASAPAYTVAQSKIKIYNISDSTDALIGQSQYCDATNIVSHTVFVAGEITIASSKTFELQHYSLATKADNGFGTNSNVGVSEVYAVVELRKVK